MISVMSMRVLQIASKSHPSLSHISIRCFAGGKPSNKKKKRKLKRKAIKAIQKEQRDKERVELQRRLPLVRLSKLHDSTKWKRVIQLADSSWFMLDDMIGPMRQTMVRCEAWCPVTTLLRLYGFQLQYWANAETLVRAFQSELAEDRYEIQSNRELWEQCNRRYQQEFVDPVIDASSDEDEDDYPNTLLDDEIDVDRVSTRKELNAGDKSDDDREHSADVQSEAANGATFDEFEANDNLTYDWNFLDKEDVQLIEESYEKDAEGEEEVDELYRYSLVRHKEISMEILQGIEMEDECMFKEITDRHSYLYQGTAHLKGWNQLPSYDSRLVWKPSPPVNPADTLQTLFGKKKK